MFRAGMNDLGEQHHKKISTWLHRLDLRPDLLHLICCCIWFQFQATFDANSKTFREDFFFSFGIRIIYFTRFYIIDENLE